jgi:hypothetical protein
MKKRSRLRNLSKTKKRDELESRDRKGRIEFELAMQKLHGIMRTENLDLRICKTAKKKNHGCRVSWEPYGTNEERIERVHGGTAK